MTKTCQVCSTQPAKYTCPSCRLLSCSLGCTQSHKIYCTPKPTVVASGSEELLSTTASVAGHNTLDGHIPGEAGHQVKEPIKFEVLRSPQELQDIFDRFPELRARLRDIYRVTLEEEWPSAQSSERGRGGHDRRRRHHRGGGGYRGPWNPNKGFNRGLGKVRKWRETCEGGQSTGPAAEGFMRFVALVGEEREPL